MIVASSVFSVGAEEALVVETLESHSEVIGFCIQRITGVGEFIFPGDGIYFGDIDVESAHSHMTVAAEVEIAVRTEGREHLIAWGVDSSPRFSTPPSPAGVMRTRQMSRPPFPPGMSDTK